MVPEKPKVPSAGEQSPARVRVVVCPVCQSEIPIGGISGRKPLGIAVKIVCDALQVHQDIGLAAKSLGCSRGYIYSELKKVGLTAKEVIHGGETS